MEGLTREDVLALRLDVAELRREIAELRRELAQSGVQSMEGRTVGDTGPYKGNASEDDVSTEQIVTEWLEGEDAWKTREK